MRYLLPGQVIDLLRVGRVVEQWLGHIDHSGYRTIRWLSIQRGNDGEFKVTVNESFDEGAPNVLDLGEFSPVDPDLLGGVVSRFETVEEAIQFAVNSGGSRDRFVGAGIMQDVYAIFLEQYGPPPRQETP